MSIIIVVVGRVFLSITPISTIYTEACMTPPLSPPLAVHHYVSTHHQPHNIGVSVHSVGRSSILHRGDEPAALARTLDPGRKYRVGSGFSGEVGGCGVGNGGCDGGGCGGGGVAAVTFSVGTTQEQQEGKQQHVRTEQPPRPPSIGSTVSVEGDSCREASSYVWRVLVWKSIFIIILHITFTGGRKGGLMIILAGVSCFRQPVPLLPELALRNHHPASRGDHISDAIFPPPKGPLLHDHTRVSLFTPCPPALHTPPIHAVATLLDPASPRGL